MKRTLVAFAMLLVLLAAACGDGGRSAAGPAATASPAAIVGPLLVYTVGSELVAWDVGGRREVRRTELEDGPQVELPPGSLEVRIAVAGGDTTSVSAIDPATGAARPVATLPRSYRPSGFLPGSDALSPDGTMLAFSRPVPGAANPDDREVGVVDIATGAERVLVTLPGVSDTYRGPASIIGWRDDGRGVLVEGTPGGPPGTWADVMLDGSIIGRLHSYGRPSPSGRAVVDADLTDSGCILDPVQRLRIWDIDANAYTAEVDDPGAGMVADDWSPDGSALLYAQYDTTRAPGSCAPDFEVSSKRWYVLEARGGPPTPVSDVAALRRSWNHGHDVTFPCPEGGEPNVWGQCPRNSPGLSVDGRVVEASGDPRILGWIDVPPPALAPSATAAP